MILRSGNEVGRFAEGSIARGDDCRYGNATPGRSSGLVALQ